MRIACVYLPSFPLQVAVRNAPHLAERPIVLLGTENHPTVLTCSRAAHDLGVRKGDSAAKALTQVPSLSVIRSQPTRERRAAEALAECLQALTPVIDVESSPFGLGEPDEPVIVDRALYLRVPHGLRGATFGAKLLAHVGRQGYRARVGIADDRFTAWAAARIGGRSAGDNHEGELRPFSQACTTVPRGGAAAFLAPLPVSMMPLGQEMLQALEALGIHRIGQFAALPRPSIGRRHTGAGVDPHALARGDGSAHLAQFSPEGPVIEHVELPHGYAQVEPLTFMLRPVLDRACDRVHGRGAAVEAIRVRLLGEPLSRSASDVLQLDIRLARPTTSGRALLDEIRQKLPRNALSLRVRAIEIHVAGETDALEQDADLFDGLRSDFALAPVMPPSRPRRTRRGKRRSRRKSADGRFVVQKLD